MKKAIISVTDILAGLMTSCRISVYYDPAHNSVNISGNPDGFKALSDILLAQAEGLGNVTPNCTSHLPANGNLNKSSRHQTLNLGLHCHPDD